MEVGCGGPVWSGVVALVVLWLLLRVSGVCQKPCGKITGRFQCLTSLVSCSLLFGLKVSFSDSFFLFSNICYFIVTAGHP